MEINKMLRVEISSDMLRAELFCTELYEENKQKITKQNLHEFLQNSQIVFGIHPEAVELLLSHPPTTDFPIEIARGIPAEDGKDGKIKYTFDFSSSVKQTEDWNFRDVMRIPSVKENDTLAKLTPPTDGKDGRTVTDEVIPAKRGKPYHIRPGKNVKFNDSDQTLYAILDGQVVINQNIIEVQPVFEVHGDVTMETGNIDFIGSVIIHGDVPAGFSIHAGGDVKVYGIVEAATIVAEGSIFIAEGFAGLQKGKLIAKGDIHVGYMNQGIAKSNGSIFVENSIMHSECEASKDIYCQLGNIIGGKVVARRLIEARDMGNRLNIKTKIKISLDEEQLEEEEKLLHKQKELEKNINNLQKIKENLLQREQTEQIKELLLRQKRSYQASLQELEEVESKIKKLNKHSDENGKIVVHRSLHPNTNIIFGKYEQVIDKEYKYVEVYLMNKEIVIRPN